MRNITLYGSSGQKLPVLWQASERYLHFNQKTYKITAINDEGMRLKEKTINNNRFLQVLKAVSFISVAPPIAALIIRKAYRRKYTPLFIEAKPSSSIEEPSSSHNNSPRNFQAPQALERVPLVDADEIQRVRRALRHRGNSPTTDLESQDPPKAPPREDDPLPKNNCRKDTPPPLPPRDSMEHNSRLSTSEIESELEVSGEFQNGTISPDSYPKALKESQEDIYSKITSKGRDSYSSSEEEDSVDEDWDEVDEDLRRQDEKNIQAEKAAIASAEEERMKLELQSFPRTAANAILDAVFDHICAFEGIKDAAAWADRAEDLQADMINRAIESTFEKVLNAELEKKRIGYQILKFVVENSVQDEILLRVRNLATPGYFIPRFKERQDAQSDTEDAQSVITKTMTERRKRFSMNGSLAQ